MKTMIEFEKKWSSAREKLRQNFQESEPKMVQLTNHEPGEAEPTRKEPAKQPKPKRRMIVPEC